MAAEKTTKPRDVEPAAAPPAPADGAPAAPATPPDAKATTKRDPVGDALKLTVFASEALRALIVHGADPVQTAGRAIEFADAMLAAEPEDFPVNFMGAAAGALGRLVHPSGDPAKAAAEAWSFAVALAEHEG